MRSQCAILLACSAGMACTGKSANPTLSPVSAPVDAPDLSLTGVAFARLSEGRIVARGTADRLDYRRAGGRMAAGNAYALIEPEAGTGLASFGALHLMAPQVDGEIVNRRGTASGGVNLRTGRGDRAFTEAVAYDGKIVHSETKVVAQGPGYRVEGNGLVAQDDGSTVQLTQGVGGQMQVEAQR